MATLYENYITGDDGNRAFYETLNWAAQTFTPSVNHSITSVKVKLLRYASSTPGTLTAEIWATDDGKPTGSALTSGTVDGSSITTTSPGEWIEITLSSGYLLLADTQYALVMKSSTDDNTKPIFWRTDQSNPTYVGGALYWSANEGVTWTLYTAEDAMFEDWGDAVTPSVPTVTTQAVSDIERTTATGNGNITDLGDPPEISQHGHCWNTTGTPTVADSKTEEGAAEATGVFTSSITGLTAGTKYYVKAYATTPVGTGYGAEVTFVAERSITLDSIEISDDVLYAHYVRGRDEELEKSPAGFCELRLKNIDGKYAPFNADSPLYGSLYPGKAIVFKWKEYTLFTGNMDKITPHPKKTAQDAYMYILDGLEYLSRAEISTPLYPGYKSGAIIDIILDEVGWDADARSIDDGYTTYSYTVWFLTKALSAIHAVETNEQGFFYIDHAGKAIFESRNHRLSATRSKISQATFTDDNISDIDYDYGAARVYNEVTGERANWAVPGVEGELARLSSENPLIPPEESRTFWIAFSEITDTVITAVKGTDVDAGSIAGDDDLNDYLTITQTNYAEGAKIIFANTSKWPMYLAIPGETSDGFKIRGEPFTANEAIKVKASDQTSIDNYQIRTYSVPTSYIENIDDLQRICTRIVHRYKDPQLMLRMTLKNMTSALLTTMLDLRISDRITVTSTIYGFDEDFYINKIEHTIENAGNTHTMILTLARAFDEEFFIVGISSLGINTRLG